MKLYRGYIFDMDGVMYRGDTPIQEAVEATVSLIRKGCKVIFVTNNSAKLASEYRDMLLNMGVAPLNEYDIITSGDVTARYLENELKKHPEKRKVLCLAEEPLKVLLREIGMDLIDPADYKTAQYVVVGFYRDFNWKIGSQAANAIAIYGAKFIGANPDPSRPVEDGEITAGTGAVVAFIETASRSKAVLMGKPYPEMFKLALQRMNLGVSDVLMVGDLLITDIKGALDMGMDSALALTGVTRMEDVERSEIKPTYVINSLRDLIPYT